MHLFKLLFIYNVLMFTRSGNKYTFIYLFIFIYLSSHETAPSTYIFRQKASMLYYLIYPIMWDMRIKKEILAFGE